MGGDEESANAVTVVPVWVLDAGGDVVAVAFSVGVTFIGDRLHHNAGEGSAGVGAISVSAAGGRGAELRLHLGQRPFFSFLNNYPINEDS